MLQIALAIAFLIVLFVIWRISASVPKTGMYGDYGRDMRYRKTHRTNKTLVGE